MKEEPYSFEELRQILQAIDDDDRAEFEFLKDALEKTLGDEDSVGSAAPPTERPGPGSE